MKPATLPALALALVAATAAQAEESCNQPVGNWKSRDAVHAMASERGWTLKRIKIDDGCYEIYGTDQDGRRFEAKIDPVTLDVIEVEDHRHHK